jgi:hypothetical protein
MIRRLLANGSADRERARGQAMVEFAAVVPILFLLVLGTFEAGRFVFHYELLNNAAREGARYAIVNGARSTCPSGPPPPGETNQCDPAGDNIKSAIRGAALDLVGTGDLIVFEPIWTSRGDLSKPAPGDTSNGHNGRGEYVTVFVDFTYNPVIEDLFDFQVLPEITISAESTLVINH